MSKIQYINKRFAKSTLAIIEQAGSILDEYSRQGFVITLRQLYYQFVARDLIPNTHGADKRLGSIVGDARLAGMLDWEHIQDRTRSLEKRSCWNDPADVIDSAAVWYGKELWVGCDHKPEVWIEKDALVGVIEDTCEKWDVPYFSCRGYASTTAMFEAGQRLRRYQRNGQTPIIIHLGDHDPSGIDMTRDIEDRLEMFTGGPVRVDRIALNYDQIEEFSPPPNPTKFTDPRSESYMEEFGEDSWELDALEPRDMNALIETAIRGVVDIDIWNRNHQEQEQERKQLKDAGVQWEDITESFGLGE